MGRKGLYLDVGIYGSHGTSGGSRAIVRRIGEGVIVGLLRTVIGRGVAVGPGMGSIGGTRGDRVVEGRRRVGRGGRIVITRIEGTISRWMRTAEEGGLRHPAMVDGGIRGGVEGRGIPLV